MRNYPSNKSYVPYSYFCKNFIVFPLEQIYDVVVTTYRKYYVNQPGIIIFDVLRPIYQDTSTLWTHFVNFEACTVLVNIA